MSGEELAAAFNIDDINEISKKYDASKAPRTYSYTHPAIRFVKKVDSSSLMSSLSGALRAFLRKFIELTGKSIVSHDRNSSFDQLLSLTATFYLSLSLSHTHTHTHTHTQSKNNIKLIYKASRDGWLCGDFLRCASMNGPTLTLIKVSRVSVIASLIVLPYR
ncbi:MAG: hypothetical protein Q7T57_03900 [Dehalococcoidales bacterium]|nr:hypothetical protein [Dehalococcoidales bacterium]